MSFHKCYFSGPVLVLVYLPGVDSEADGTRNNYFWLDWKNGLIL